MDILSRRDWNIQHIQNMLKKMQHCNKKEKYRANKAGSRSKSRCGLVSGTYKGVGEARQLVRCDVCLCRWVCVQVMCVKGYRADITLPGAN